MEFKYDTNRPFKTEVFVGIAKKHITVELKSNDAYCQGILITGKWVIIGSDTDPQYISGLTDRGSGHLITQDGVKFLVYYNFEQTLDGLYKTIPMILPIDFSDAVPIEL